MGKALAVANQKGGVGKTTTAVNLAACLACAERPTLMVDLDPQGNATTGLGMKKSDIGSTIYGVLIGGDDMQEAVHETAVPGLSIVPSGIDLVGAEIELVAMPSRESRLRTALEPIRDQFHYLVIDCPPSLGLLTINALTAADSVLIPLQCEFYALEGLAHLMRTVKLVRDRLNPGLAIEGILLTMFDGRTSLAAQVKDEVHRYFEGQIFETVIPRNIRLTEAPSHGRPIVLYDLRSTGAIAYLELTREVLGHEQ
jgi:chromosome partitioning protein